MAEYLESKDRSLGERAEVGCEGTFRDVASRH